MKFFEKVDKFYSENTSKAVIITSIVLVIGFCLLYWSVEATSTPEFCVSCHEMKPQYNTWKESTHYNITGVNPNVTSKEIATCRNCHLPPWSKPVTLLTSKAYHGSKDIIRHYTDKDEFKYKGYYYDIRISARKSILNDNCLTCHKDIMRSEKREIKLFHSALKRNKQVSCVHCHKNMVHGHLNDI